MAALFFIAPLASSRPAHRKHNFFARVVTMRASGLPAADSKPVSVKGLLFKTPGMPTLVTRTMREHHDD